MGEGFQYLQQPPDQAQLVQSKGPLLLLFGSPSCPHCIAFEPLLAELLREFPELPCIAVEDGRGRRLGRLFAVKWWPTLILLEDGQETVRAVRASDLVEFRQALRGR